MVLTLFRGLLNTALKCEWRKLTMTRPHLLTVTPWSPNSDPVVYSTWIVVTLTMGDNCQDPAQTEDTRDPGRADCSTSPRPSWSVPQLPPPQERFLRSPVAGGQTLMIPWYLHPQGKPWRPWEPGPFELTQRPFGSASCSVYPPQTVAIYSSFHMEKSGLAFSRAPKWAEKGRQVCLANRLHIKG